MCRNINDLNGVALKYCNNTYVDGGVCNSDNTWNFNDIDFKKISGYSLRDKFNKDGDYSSNDLINNGSFYWFSTAKEMDLSYFWSQKSNVIDVSRSDSVLGVRPVIKLKSSIVVTGGNGTYHEPYVIK